MKDMIFIQGVIAGIGGTLLMTLFAYLVAYVTHRPLKVVKVLVAMITFQPPQRKAYQKNLLLLALVLWRITWLG